MRLLRPRLTQVNASRRDHPAFLCDRSTPMKVKHKRGCSPPAVSKRHQTLASPCAVVVRFVGRDRGRSHRRRTAAFVSTRQLLLASWNGRNRRNLAARTGTGECPKTTQLSQSHADREGLLWRNVRARRCYARCLNSADCSRSREFAAELIVGYQLRDPNARARR